MKIRPASRLSERVSTTAKSRKPSLVEALKKKAASSIEALESRIAPATVVTLSGGHLSVQGDAGNDQLSFTVDTINGTLTILNAAGENVTTSGVIDEDGVVNNQVTFALNAITGDFTVNTGGGTDSLSFNSALGLPGNFTATTSGGITFNAGLSFTATGKNIIANAGGTISLPNGTSDLATTGAGSILLTAGRNISLSIDSSLKAENGNIVLNANTGGTGTGSFEGITVAGEISSLGSGAIQLMGVGGNTGSSNHGINLNGGRISSSGTGAVMLDGRGGGSAGSSDNDGIIFRASSQISANAGGISITGTAGVGASGSESLNLESTSITSSASNIALITDAGLLIQGSATINAGANTVTLQPKTNGTPINLGIYSDGSFGIDNSQLNRINAGAVQIGNSTAGAISVSAPITYGNHLSLVSNAGVSGAGALTLTGGKNLGITANGAINLSGMITVSGDTTLTAGAANGITLNNGGNNFNSVQIVSGNNVTLADANAINFGSGTSTISGTLGVTAGGAITQTGAILVTGASSFSAGGNAITLTHAGNNFVGAVSLSNTGANAIALTDSNALVLGTVSAGQNLTITASGAITQNGTIVATGGITALSAGASNNITLSNAGNDFGTVNVISGSTVTLRDDSGFNLGGSNVSTLLSLESAGTITQSGALTGTGGLVKLGTGTLTLGIVNTYAGGTAINGGTLSVSADANLGSGNIAINGGTLAITGSSAFSSAKNISFGAGVDGTLDITNTVGATLSGSLSGGGSNGVISKTGSGTLTLTGNSTLGSGAHFHLRSGTVVIDGGSVTANGTWQNIGFQAGDVATLTIQNGGSFNTDNDFNVADHGGTGIVNIIGAGSALNAGAIYIGKGISGPGTGTVNQSGGTVTAGRISLTSSPTGSVGTYNLSGGTLITTEVAKGSGSTATFNFDGGTLRASASNANFMAGLTAANVKAGGAFIDTNGFNIQIAQSLLHDAALGATPDGGLTKLGTGTLTLASANTYSGATTISAGTLALQNTYASPSFAIASGTVLELNVASGTRDYASASFTGAGTLRKTGSGSALWGVSAATFALGAGGLIDVQGGIFIGGSSDNEVWTSNLASLNVAAGARFEGVEANVRVDQITGTGTIASGYNGLGSITFGVNNGSSTFSGVLADTAGHIGKFTKTGTGTITLTGANTYSGTTTITAGTLQVGSGGTTGTLGSGAVTNDSNLAFNRSDAFTVGNSISGTGTLTVANSGGATFNGNVSQGAVTLTATTGTIAFNGNLSATSLNTTNAGYSVALRGATTSITNDVNFLNTGTVTLGDGGDILTFSGGLATSGNASNPSGTTIAGTVRTNGQGVDLGVVTLAGNSTIDTTNAGGVPAGANLSIIGTINADAVANNRTLTLTAGNGLLTLSGAVGGVQALHTLTTTSGTLAALPALTIGAGGLSVSTTGGAITQTGAIVVAGTSSFVAGSNAITLNNSANDFTGAVSLSNSGANNVAITDVNAIVIGTSTVGSGTLQITANGISQTGTITQAASAGAVTLSGGTGSIALGLSNNFTGAVTASSTGAGQSITLRDGAGGLNVASASTNNGAISLEAVGGNLSVTSATAGSGTVTLLTTTSGDIQIDSVSTTGTANLTSAGAIQELGTDGATDLTAGTATLVAATGIGVGNAIETAIGRLEARTTSGGVQINNVGALTIGGISAENGVTTGTGDIIISSSGALTIEELISTNDNVTLDVNGTITETGAGAIHASNLLTISLGGQTLNGANTVARFDALNTGSGDISLVNTAATLTVARIANLVGSATVSNTGNIQLGDALLNQNINVANIAAITATGAITDGNAATNNITALAAVLAGGTGIGSAADRIETNIAYLEANGGTGGVYITEANALTIGGAVPSPIGVRAGGDIVIQSGALTIEENIDTTATVTLDASGTITETFGAVKNAALLTTISNGTQQLTGANTVRAFTATNNGSGTAIVLKNNSLAGVNPGGLTINNVSNQTGGLVDIDNTGDVTVVGAVTSGESPLPLGGNISIASTGLLTVAASGSVNSRVGSGGSLTLANQVLINGSVIVGAGNVTLTGGAGDMNINAPITVETPLTLLATGNINIRAKVETTLTTSNLTLTADTDFDAQGGIRVFPQGELKAGKDLTLTGSDYTGTPELDSIIIDADAAGLQQVGAFGNIRLLNGGGAPAGAATYLSGYVNAITNGNVTFEHAVQLAADTARVSTHGGGNILFNDTVGGAFDLRLSAPEGLVTFDGAVGSTLVPVGNVTVDSALDVTVGAAFNAETFTVTSATGSVNLLAPVSTFASGANLVVNAKALNIEGAVNAHDGNIVWSIDNLAIQANVSGTGSLTVQPLTQGRSIGVNATGDLNLTTAEIAYLQDGFESIQIGSTTGRSVITIGGATFLDPVSIVSPATGGAINVTGPIVGTGDASVALRAPAITLNVGAPVAAISTQSGAVSLNGSVTLAANTVISTVAAGTGGAFVQDGTINGAYALEISTGTAPITFNGIGSTTSTSIGGTTALASLDLDGGVVTLRPGIVTTGSQSYTGTEINLLGGSLRSTKMGTIEFFGPVDLSQGISISTAGFAGTGVIFHGDVRNEALNAGALRITAGSGAVIFAGDIGTSVMPLASFAIQSAGLAQFGGKLYSAGAIQIAADEIDFNGGAGSIHGSGELVLKPNDPTVVTHVGGTVDQMGIFDLTQADIAALADGFSKITIGRDLGTAGLVIVSGPTGVTFTDPVVFEQSGRAGVITVLGDLHGVDNASFDFCATTVVLGGGSALSITTQGGAVSFDATLIASDVTVDTGGGTGAITFRSTILDPAGGHDLTLSAGFGDISLLKSVGSAKGATLGAIDITTGGLTRINSAVRAESFALNADAPMGTAEILAKSITTTGGDGQIYNTHIQLNSSVRFTSNSGPITFGGEIDSRPGKAYSALVSAGTGNILFIGDIGSDEALGTLRAKTKGIVTLDGSAAARGVQISAATFTVHDVYASISQSYSSTSTTVAPVFAGELSGEKLKITSKSDITSSVGWNITGRVALKAGINSISLTGANQFGEIDVAAANVEIHEAGAMHIRSANVSSTLTLQAFGDITDGTRLKLGKLVATSLTGSIILDGVNRIASLGAVSAQTGVLILSGGTTLSLTGVIATETGNIVIVGNDRSSNNVVLAGGSIQLGAGAGYFRIYTFDQSLSNLGALGAVYTEVNGNRYPYAPTGADALVDAVIAVQA